MKKRVVSKLFLYRYRFYIGYLFLGLAFLSLVFFLPLLSPAGLSESEMSSVVTSYNLHFSSITTGDLVDLPYHIVQKIFILIFGMNIYTIKLPSIIIGAILGFLIVLLLNRWFKSNVALLSSILTVLSVPFLYLVGSGTPAIMLVFWPTLLLWLGSKIQGVKKPRPLYSFIFAICLISSIFTPHMVYLDAFIVIFALINPHLRFTIKTLPRGPFIVTSLFVLACLAMLVVNIASNPSIGFELLFSKDYVAGDFFANLKLAFAPFFNWGSPLEGTLLTPLISLASLFLAFSGLFSTTKGFFASRNSIASFFIFFTIILSGFDPDSSMLIILPLAILIAHGLRYTLEKWYNIFPENPYARVLGVFPIAIFIGIMITSGLTHYIFGYRYAPAVANQFNDDLSLVISNLDDTTTLLLGENSLEYAFYEVYEDRTHDIDLTAFSSQIDTETVATLGNSIRPEGNWQLSQIITSPKSDNSDRIYIYTSIKN